MRDLNVVMHGDDDVSLRPVITHDDRKRHRTEPARTNVEVDGRLNGICSSSPAYLVTEICMRLPRSRWASEEMRILVFGITIRKEYIRLAREVVPNRFRLQGKRIDGPGECGVCSKEHDDDWHLYLTCLFAVDCWIEAGLTHTVEDSMARQISFPGWLGDFMTRVAKSNRVRIDVVLWELWKEKNHRV
ncbi:hypothetical protein LINPERHAP2_LOCUS16639 [Linum perenne]